MPSVYLLLAGLLTGIAAASFDTVNAYAFCLAVSLAFGFARFRKWGLRGFFFAAMVWLGFRASFKSEGPDLSPRAVAFRAPCDCASLEGTVIDLPAVKLTGKKSRVRFVLSTERFLSMMPECGGDSELPRMDNLVVQNVSGLVQVFLVNPASLPRPGDRVRVFGKLQIPRSPPNPGQMDYEAYLAARRIYATFSGVGTAALRIEKAQTRLSWDACVQRFRGVLAERLDRIFGVGDQHAELLKALLLGLRSQLPQELWQVMMRTGTSHILSISGLHMSVLSAFVYGLFLRIFRSQKKAAAGTAAALILYMFLAGASVPVQRATWMGVAAYVGVLVERDIQPLRLLAWACLLQLIKNPQVLESISFQLSFLSVWILLLIRYLPPVHWILEPFRATALVIAGTLPVAAWHFHMISWSALVANLWAIPFFNFALITGAGALIVTDVPGIGWLVKKICVLCLDSGLWGLQVLAQWRSGWTMVAQPPIWKIAHYYAWTVGWFLVMGLPVKRGKAVLRPLVLMGWVIAGCFFWVATGRSAWSVTVLAETQMPLIHIQSKKEDWLINMGQGSGSYETQHRLVPYLKWRGVQQLGGIILTDYPKDVDLSLRLLQNDVVLKKVAGPAPKVGQRADLFSKTSMTPWQRADFTPGIRLGQLLVKTLSQHGKVKLIQLTADGGETVFFIMRLDAESLAVIEQANAERTVLVFFDSAGRKQKNARPLLNHLQKTMAKAVWFFEREDHRGQFIRSQKSPIVKSYALQNWGALQIRAADNSGKGGGLKPPGREMFNLQSLSGT